MAEFVHQSIEEALPELEQLERIGLFTKPEIKSIIKKKRSHEYRLVRRRKEKDDFLRYIQYEISLLSLIKTRREKIRYFFKKEEIDFSIVSRIAKLFRRTCTLFPEDLKVWLSYMEFLKKWNKKSMLSKMMTNMLKIHGNNPGLWIMAAKFQMEDNSSSENARSLLLRALRHHPTSQKIWQEYFRMELMHADKLRKRWTLLKQSDMKADEEEMSDALMEGQAAKIVYKKALEEIQNDAEFHLSFIPLLQQFDFTSKLEDEIYTDVQTTHPSSEIVWDAVARRHLPLKAEQDETKVLCQEEQCFKVYEEASTRLDTPKMWCMYATACLERIDHQGPSKLNEKRAERALRVLSTAAEHCKLSMDIYTHWVRLLLRLGMLDKAITTATMATDAFQDSSALWKQKLTLHVASSETGNETDKKNIRQLFDEAINKVKTEDALSIWEYGLQWYQENDTNNIESLMQRGLNEHPRISVTVKEYYLDWGATQGIGKLRKVFKKLVSTRPLAVGFYQKYIDIEISQENPKMTRIRAAYEDALNEFGSTNPELWLAYIRLEMQHPMGKPEMVSKLHWRAMKGLDGNYTEKFVSSYTLLQAGHL
ncbi:U3 small nucleolar RNA-associated protein 6 homolog isoform X2 [Anneissia japonica]|uniref:U3 small nucleolar RNA-associated protein 6 homolog isoform X1 n=1 Tax=Anneissia japonica TaxID=1529436 RepID=UPI001425762F|nr:U3 small nucleolar RNA-associated protein 6 homolog isoform X1 [Anneissia japonica]XP_033097479.1 U3 small nucleolar RNA-associated protein 6 homolog isoform X2 [Anneissia japonica]